jgi:hypothetical protein
MHLEPSRCHWVLDGRVVTVDEVYKFKKSVSIGFFKKEKKLP